MIDLNHYILSGKKIIKVDLLTWGKWFGTNRKKLADTWLPGRVNVSTVFLGINHNFCFDNKQPLLFETMIFGGKYDQWQERYYTYKGAMAGHRRAVKMVQRYKTAAFLKPRDRHKNRFSKLPFIVQMKLTFPKGFFINKPRG